MDQLIADETAMRQREYDHDQHIKQVKEMQIGKQKQIDDLR